jgi:5-methyltetrahydropteroyltriglutamate--homocysteine methyltransferase
VNIVDQLWILQRLMLPHVQERGAMKIRGNELLIPTSMVGNYPNPRWWDAHFARFFNGDQNPPDSIAREALEDAMGAVVRDQESAGLDIISDGRIQADNYGDILYYYMRKLGYEIGGGQLAFPIYSRLHAATLRQPIKKGVSLMLEQARALRAATQKPVKVQYTGIQVLTQCTTDLHYKNPRDVALNIAEVYTAEFKALDALGVEFVQIDEFTWPYFFEPYTIEAFNAAIDGVKAQIVCHVCWGNWGGTPAYYPDESGKPGEVYDLSKRHGKAPSATASVIPEAYKARFNVLNLESCGRRSDDLSGLEVIKANPLPPNVAFWAGVIDVKSTVCETAEEVAGRIEKLLELVPADRLGVTTDCGLILLQRYIAKDKLHALVAGTNLVRAKLAGTRAAG